MTRRLRQGFAILLATGTAVALIQACGNNGASPFGTVATTNGPNSCDLRGIASVCNDFNANQGQSSCPGTFSTNLCPKDPSIGYVGSCATAYVTVNYYSSGPSPFTASQAQQNCPNNGTTTWSPAPSH